MKTVIIDVSGIGPASEKILAENGFKTLKELAGTTVEKLGNVPGFSEIRASKVIKAANELLATTGTGSAKVARSKISREQKTEKKGTGGNGNDKNRVKLKQEKPKKEKLAKAKAKKAKKAKLAKAKAKKAKKAKLAKAKAKKAKSKSKR
jgi:hypothetical protein